MSTTTTFSSHLKRSISRSTLRRASSRGPTSLTSPLATHPRHCGWGRGGGGGEGGGSLQQATCESAWPWACCRGCCSTKQQRGATCMARAQWPSARIRAAPGGCRRPPRSPTRAGAAASSGSASGPRLSCRAGTGPAAAAAGREGQQRLSEREVDEGQQGGREEAGREAGRQAGREAARSRQEDAITPPRRRTQVSLIG